MVPALTIPQLSGPYQGLGQAIPAGEGMKEPDFARAAAELVTRHGETAEMLAAEAIDTALEQGDETGFNEWTRIGALIAQSLRQSAPPAAPKPHAGHSAGLPFKRRAVL
jgi:hypothetical protein